MKNQLSQTVIEDGQTIRPFWNYIQDTFNDLKGHEFEFDGTVFNDEIDFYLHLQGVLNMMIKVQKDVNLDKG